MNTRTDKHSKSFWQSLDKKSRDLIFDALEAAGAKNIYCSQTECVWDLSAVINDQKVSIEVKDRNLKHDDFGDVLVQIDKQIYTQRNYDFDRSLAVNCFTDGYVCISDLYDEKAKFFQAYAPITTMLGDRRKTLKDFVSLPQTVKLKKENGKWLKK